MDTENVEIIKAMVKTGLGIGIVPYIAIAREVRARQFFCARVDGHELVRETGWVYRRASRPPRMIEEMLSAFEKVQGGPAAAGAAPTHTVCSQAVMRDRTLYSACGVRITGLATAARSRDHRTASGSRSGHRRRRLRRRLRRGVDAQQGSQRQAAVGPRRRKGREGHQGGHRGGGRGGGAGHGGGFGGAGSGGGAGPGRQGGNAEDVQRLRNALRDELEAPEHLTIVESGSTIILTAGDGRTTRLSADGKKIKDESTKVERRTKWDAGKLVSEVSRARSGQDYGDLQRRRRAQAAARDAEDRGRRSARRRSTASTTPTPGRVNVAPRAGYVLSSSGLVGLLDLFRVLGLARREVVDVRQGLVGGAWHHRRRARTSGAWP